MNKREKELTLKYWKENRLTIYDVKRLVVNAPYFFVRKTMSFFRQTLRDYHVNKTVNQEVYYIWAESWGNCVTERYFNVIDHKFYSDLDAAIKGEKSWKLA